MLYNLQDAIEAYDNDDNFIFFWGHSGLNKKCCFSQWYPSEFTVDGVTYQNTEQWMMAQKALLFKDTEVCEEIMACSKPQDVKEWGRRVKGFLQSTWDREKYNIVLKGNIQKFLQNKDMKDYLLSTNDAILVEASPYDRVWGIGMYESKAVDLHPKHWNGENLLGFALMEVREAIRDK